VSKFVLNDYPSSLLFLIKNLNELNKKNYGFLAGKPFSSNLTLYAKNSIPKRAATTMKRHKRTMKLFN
jgi:hypothetical protein